MDTKLCVSCKQTFPLDCFSFKNKIKKTLQSRCKKCYNLYNREYYSKFEKEKQVARVSNNVRKLREKFQLWKTKQKCSLCNEDSVECLDLHHIDPKTKDNDVSYLLAYNSWTRITNEIKKCVVVCSNCHRKIHSGRIKSPNITTVV